MHLMLQQETPDDFVIATGRTHSVRDFPSGPHRAGLDYRDYVTVREEFFRPSEVHLLQGDAAKAHAVLGWQPVVGFEELVDMMVDHDLAVVARRRGETKSGMIPEKEKEAAFPWLSIHKWFDHRSRVGRVKGTVGARVLPQLPGLDVGAPPVAQVISVRSRAAADAAYDPRISACSAYSYDRRHYPRHSDAAIRAGDDASQTQRGRGEFLRRFVAERRDRRHCGGPGMHSFRRPDRGGDQLSRFVALAVAGADLHLPDRGLPDIQ